MVRLCLSMPPPMEVRRVWLEDSTAADPTVRKIPSDFAALLLPLRFVHLASGASLIAPLAFDLGRRRVYVCAHTRRNRRQEIPYLRLRPQDADRHLTQALDRLAFVQMLPLSQLPMPVPAPAPAPAPAERFVVDAVNAMRCLGFEKLLRLLA